MSDKEARALGAGEYVTIGETEYRLAPIGMRQLQEVQKLAIKAYKREYLTTVKENLDLLDDPGAARELMEKKIDEVAKWDIGNLPVKMAYDTKHVALTPELIARMEAEFGELPPGELSRKAILSSALDAGMITFEEVAQLSGNSPRRGRVPYDTWWVTASFDGMVTFVWTSVRSSTPSITREMVGDWPLPKIMEAARSVERITSPALGNT